MEEHKKQLAEKFRRIGLSENTANETTANNKVAGILSVIIDEAGVADGCDRSIGTLLYKVATEYPSKGLGHRSTVIRYIASSKINSNAKLAAAFKFVESVSSEPLNLDDFERSCGAGVEVSEEDLRATINNVSGNVKVMFGLVMKKHPWADPKIVKNLLEGMGLSDQKTDTNSKPEKKKKDKKISSEKKVDIETTDNNPFSIFPSPEENSNVHRIPLSDGHVLECSNSKCALEKHSSVDGSGKAIIRTRFPPEPNGALHIGHAKAMFVNFRLAEDRGGECYLRFDDTNPEAEKKEYIDQIKFFVSWMGWEPTKITYTSDYYKELYEFAKELIRRGCAYVDHQTKDDLEEYRKQKKNSPWRDRPIEESLKLFEEMKNGLFKEGEATLRMKQDMQNVNVNMRDQIAYRIKFSPHPRTGDEWCIYPSYDFSHCIVDSLENITHSLCTLEFETRRDTYYWLLHSLDLYLPHVWEYSRLNISHTVMSKRKLNRLVTEKHVNGWDDPRLMTLAALKRRGVTSTIINAFVQDLGITRSESLISMHNLESHIRRELDKKALPRAMVVVKPLKVVITNMEEGLVMEREARKFQNSESFYKVPFSNVVYIEESDFRKDDHKDFYGLAPGKLAMLKYAFPIKCTEVITSEDNESVLEIRAEYYPSFEKAPKGILHWVAESDDLLKVEVRLYEKLFMSENPAKCYEDCYKDCTEEHWLKDLNKKDSKDVTEAFAVSELRTAKPSDMFQFERLGYFVVDEEDSTSEKLVFNRTVALPKKKISEEKTT